MSNEVAKAVVEVAETIEEIAVPAQKTVNTATRVFWKVAAKTQKHSPKILMGAGILGVVTAGVLACRATLKLEGVVAEANEKIADVKDRRTVNEFDSESEFNKELTKAHANRVYQVGKLYAAPISVGLVGIGCLLGAHGIMNQRQIALAAAAKAAESTLNEYRKRVADEFGEDKERELRFGLTEQEVPQYNDKGEVVGTKKELVVGMDPHSPYARIFDETNDMWSKVPGQNQMFLSNQQNWLNDRLNARGHLFLNDVYKCLGFPETTAGQVVGWLRSDHEDSKDGFVDFGLMEIENAGKRDFVNGFERSCILDFNVDGQMFTKI